ncbi:WD repeat-containing protein, partial [Reticulomyxa filosa]
RPLPNSDGTVKGTIQTISSAETQKMKNADGSKEQKTEQVTTDLNQIENTSETPTKHEQQLSELKKETKVQELQSKEQVEVKELSEEILLLSDLPLEHITGKKKKKTKQKKKKKPTETNPKPRGHRSCAAPHCRNNSI